MAILLRHKDSIFGLNPALAQLQTNITAEETRAIAEETRIAGLVAAEEARAIAAESNLQANIDAEVTRATAAEGVLQNNIDAEVTRATAAETVLQANIDAEVTRATAAETAISSSVTTEVARLDSAISAEAAARIAEDTAIDARLDNIEAGLVAGVVPMGSFAEYSGLDTLVEANLQHGWAYYINNENDLMMYVSEGTQFDYQPAGFTFGFIKYADYTELSGLVNTEQARAVAAEAALQANIDAEVARATAAEGVLTADVAANATAISAEVTRATAAEAQIATDLASEVARATAAEAALEASKMSKSANLSDLADVAVARTNLDVYSKDETDAAVSTGGAVPKVEFATVTAGKITLTHAPKEGINGIMNFSTVRYTDANGVSYDAPVVATGVAKEFTVSTDTAGQWDGFSVQVQYLYVPSV